MKVMKKWISLILVFLGALTAHTQRSMSFDPATSVILVPTQPVFPFIAWTNGQVLPGGTIASEHPFQLDISAGSALTNGTWVARDTRATIMQLNGESVDWSQDIGLTAGSVYSTTRRAKLSMGGLSAGAFYPFGVTVLNCYGDSFTAGNGASVASSNFVALIAANKPWTVNNLGVGGSQLQESGQMDSIYGSSISQSTASTLLTGVNDMRANGTDATKLARYEDELLAAIVRLAIPDLRRTPASSMTPVGFGSANGLYSLTTGRSSGVGGNTLTANVAGSVIYVGATKTNAGGGSFSVTVDGWNFGSWSCSGATVSPNGRTYQPFVARIPNLQMGSHVVVVTALGGGLANIDWVSGNYDNHISTGPFVYVGDCCRLNATGYTLSGPTYNNGSDQAVFSYNASIQKDVNIAASDGLQVVLARASEHYILTGQVNADNIHPNDAGHAAIFAAFDDAMSSGTPQSKQSGAVSGTGYISPISLGQFPNVTTINPTHNLIGTLVSSRRTSAGATTDGTSWFATDTSATILSHSAGSFLFSADVSLTPGSSYTPTTIAEFDSDTTAGNTRFLLWDVTAGTLKRVSVGINDSGGAGFKVLRVPN